MSTSFSVRSTTTKRMKEEYKDKLDSMSLEDLVKEFFSFLDYTEESESGREFHPISIGSCRALMSEPLGMCLAKMREKSNG